MSVSSHLSTAVHALCWLELAARRGRTKLTSAEIASSLASNPVQVRRELAPLRHAGLVQVVGRGPGGGWALGRPAEMITLKQVSDAIGEERPFALHPHAPNPECPVGAGIRPVLGDVYDDVQAAIARELDGRTVADVLDRILKPS
ncbi:Rrf2 family transcriptional regulator [Knoellia pratensis]